VDFFHRFPNSLTFPPFDRFCQHELVRGFAMLLDTLAFAEYTEKCRIWANESLGLQIPLPGEITV
jgi:hypothetical protein